MKKVLWISRHMMTVAQKNDLERITNDVVEVVQVDKTIANVRELEPLLDGVDIVAAVLPLDKVAGLLKITGSIPVIQAVSARVPTGKLLTLPDGRTEQEYLFEHQYWQRIVSVDIKTERL